MGFSVLKKLINRFRRSNGSLDIPEHLQVQNNVFLTMRERGKIVGRRESHNVVTNTGRQWLRGLCSALSYPDMIPVDTPASNLNVNAFDAATNVQEDSKYRVRYIAYGVGGTMQGVTPPGVGTFTEVVTRYGLESPVEYVRNGATIFYLAQVVGQDLTDTAYAPNNFTIRFRRVAVETDISYALQPTYGTSVPLSEIGLFTSAANSIIHTSPVEGAGAIGMVAYNTFATITKTPLFQLEVVWEWRF